MLNGIGPSVARGRDTSLLKDLLGQAIDRMADELVLSPTIDLTVRSMIGKAQFDLGDFNTALETVRPAFERLHDSPETRNDPERLRAGTQLGSMLVEAGKVDDAVHVLRETVDGYARRGDQSSDQAVAARIALGSALIHSRKFDEALDLDRVTLLELQHSGRADSELAMVLSNAIASIYRSRGELDSAVRDWQALLARQQALFGNDHPGTLATMSNLAFAYHDMQRFDDAERIDQQILAIERTLYEPGHPNLVKTLNNLGAELLALNRLNEAEPVLLEAEQIARAKLEPTHRYALAVEVQLMNLRSQQGRFNEAVEIAVRIRDTYARQYGAADARTFAAQTIVIGSLADAQRFADAIKLIDGLGPDPVPHELGSEQSVAYHAAVADVLLRVGRIDEAGREAALARAFAVAPADGDASPSWPAAGTHRRDARDSAHLASSHQADGTDALSLII